MKEGNEAKDVFEVMAGILGDSDYTTKEVQRALKSISSSLAALKSMDGMTHQLQKSFGDRYDF